MQATTDLVIIYNGYLVIQFYQPSNLSNISNLYININLVFTRYIGKSILIISNGSAFTNIGFSASYFSLPEKQLIYTPKFQNVSTLTFRHRQWGVGLNGKYISRRYSTSTNSDTKPLPVFYLLNASADYTRHIKHLSCTAFVTYGNLLGVAYEWVQSFPMPRYEFTLGLQIDTSL